MRSRIYRMLKNFIFPILNKNQIWIIFLYFYFHYFFIFISFSCFNRIFKKKKKMKSIVLHEMILFFRKQKGLQFLLSNIHLTYTIIYPRICQISRENARMEVNWPNTYTKFNEQIVNKNVYFQVTNTISHSRWLSFICKQPKKLRFFMKPNAVPVLQKSLKKSWQFITQS